MRYVIDSKLKMITILDPFYSLEELKDVVKIFKDYTFSVLPKKQIDEK